MYRQIEIIFQGSKTMRKSPPMLSLQEPQWRKLSQIAGGILLVIAFFWLLKLLFFSTPSTSSLIPSNSQGLAPFSSSGNAITTPASLSSAGITLEGSATPSTMSQKQALQLASQLQSEAAAGAKKTVAQAVLLDYPASAGVKGHTSYQHLPVWMIWYQQVPQGGNGIAIDNQPNHDLYVFLDVKTGQEVLTIWS
jgi:hypothetical protein